MSRTHNTDPYIIQGYRAQGRRPPSDWRERKNGTPPHRIECPSLWAEWWATNYPDPGKSWMYDRRGSSKDDRRRLQKHLRQRTRQAIAHEDYDADLRPDHYAGWLFYTY